VICKPWVNSNNVISLGRMRWAGHVVRLGNEIFSGKTRRETRPKFGGRPESD
jgi:hypothetical protein